MGRLKKWEKERKGEGEGEGEGEGRGRRFSPIPSAEDQEISTHKSNSKQIEQAIRTPSSDQCTSAGYAKRREREERRGMWAPEGTERISG